jgi:Mg2+ and Co2+ transporter CorA
LEEKIMDDMKELLEQMASDIKSIKEKVERMERNQLRMANAEHKNWHMLADKLEQYDMVLFKLFGKKKE